ncbi:MAG: hypothetical protein HY360_05155, partial [Verrucomicrobia bacterium]|nr:hypothetical protein [Verrucomicrobiota bacterium]
MFPRFERQRMRRTLEGRRVRNFLHASLVLRWFIALMSMAGLIGLAIFGSRWEPLDLSEGQICPRTIVARVNFSYEDENATTLERNRKASLAPDVCRLSMDAYQRDQVRVEHLLNRVALIRPGSKTIEAKLKQIADTWNEGARVPLSTTEIQSLIFVPDKKALLETLQRQSAKLAEGGIAKDDLFPNPETPIAFAAQPADFPQMRHAKAGQFPTTTQARQRLLKQLSASFDLARVSPKAVESILTDLLAPNLDLDLALTVKFQERQRRSVEPVSRNVMKGNTLVERGERLTQDKLFVLKKHEAEAAREFSGQSRWRQRVATGAIVALIVGAAILILAFQPVQEHPTTNREYGLLATIVLLHFALCRLTVYLADTIPSLSPSLTASILPSCFGPMLVAVLIHRRHANVAAFVCSFLLAVITQFNFAVMLSSLISAVIGVHFLSPLRRRTKIYEAGLMAGIAAAMVNIIFGFMWDVPWEVMGWQGGMAVA